MFSSTEFFRFFENGQKQSCVTSFTMQEHFSQIGNESKIKLLVTVVTIPLGA